MPSIALPVSLRGQLLTGTRAFNPISLFASNEPGVWYDPSDFSTMFQDAAGTTPVTAVEQSVGLVLDKSKGLVLGPELVTNGDFSNGTTGWTPTGATQTVVNGELQVTSAISTYGSAQSITVEANKSYRVSLTSRAGTGAPYINIGSGGVLSSQYATGLSGNISRVIHSTGTTLTITLGVIGTATAFFDNISVRELPGNHATQSTSASRPVLSARYNLLTATERFDDAAWVKTNATVTANAAVAPDGTTTADTLVEASDTNLLHSTNISASSLLSGESTFSVAVKSAGRNWVLLNFAVINGTYSSSDPRAWFDISNGAVGTVGGSGVTASISSLGNGWYRCTLKSSAYSGANRKVLIATATGDAITSHNGDGTSGIYLWGADLRVTNDGVNLPVYQRVNTATDYDTVGFPPYLRFDGSDDFLQTGTITPGVDKAQVFAGVRKLSDVAVGVVAEYSADSSLSAGSFNFFAPLSTGAGGVNYSFGARGSAALDGTLRVDIAATAPAPDTSVFASENDISGDITRLRRNGSVAGTATGDKGTGNFLAYPLYIGRRGIMTRPFNGRLFGLVVRFGPNLSADQITQMENWMNGKTRAF